MDTEVRPCVITEPIVGIDPTEAGLADTKSGPCCRSCGRRLYVTMVDLGMSPLCESYVTSERLNRAETFYPLHVYVCDRCFLVQLEQYVAAEEIFTEYAYFSSFADSWVDHARNYVEMITARFGLGCYSQVIELASNDGYLLQHFLALGIPASGVEPAANVAEVALAKGIATRVQFFNTATAEQMVDEGCRADLIIGNNVLAQVPNLNDFVAGMKILLKADGVITMEFPHLLELMRQNQFDTIYHEHFSYFTFRSVERIFARHGIVLFDVEVLSTHGGSLRIYGRHIEDATKPVAAAVQSIKAAESAAGMERLEAFVTFGERVKETKRKLLEFLIRTRRECKQIVGYGAPGKGNTLLNYCGIRTDFLDYTVDRNPYKQGKFLPGSHIPIYSPERIRETRPDYVLILPWNLRSEIMGQLSYIREWGGRFMVPIPELQVFNSWAHLDDGC
jgi:C-methyltransferase C-terminal domain/Putative zinc binding domain/Methyltransferase domain